MLSQRLGSSDIAEKFVIIPNRAATTGKRWVAEGDKSKMNNPVEAERSH